MTRSYFDGWQTTERDCPKCGWHGTLNDADHEVFRDLMEVNCPKCMQRLDIVPFPTIDEALATPNLSAADRLYYETVLAVRTRFEDLKLKSPDQLPDIGGPSIVLAWDCVGDGLASECVISYSERVIWREPAVFEGYRRFMEVVEILKARYGSRLFDVVPTRASELDLYGDALAAPDIIKRYRAGLRDA